MATLAESIQAKRAAIFDWSVMIISFLLGFAFPSLSDIIKSPLFFDWMLASLLFYSVGAALKHLPLSYRLTYSSRRVETVPYIIFLLVGHWMIMLFLVILSEPAIRTLFHMAPLTSQNSASPRIVGLSMFIATLVTWMVYRTKGNRKGPRKHSPALLFRMELAADILLIMGVSIFSFVFWEKGAMAMLSRASTRSIGDIWFLFIFLGILFLFFYLPLRYLFFMEDRKNSGNRRRLFLIFGFMLLKALFELLRI